MSLKMAEFEKSLEERTPGKSLKNIEKSIGPMLNEADVKNCNQIAAEILKENKFIFCDGIFYKYESGVFLPCKEDKIRRIIKEKLGDKFNQHKANEIIHSIRVDIALNDSEELNSTDMLNLHNGMFSLGTGEIMSHSEDYLSTIRLPVNYDPQATCPKWIKTIDEIFEGDKNKIDTIQEFFGLCFTKDQRYEKAMFLVGEGKNGKSTILHILQKLLGKKNYSAIPLELFNDPHYAANLYNKLCNVTIETNAKSSVYDARMKAIISGDEITADAKYQPLLQFNPFCKLVFALNNMPRVDDKTDAFYRRLIIVRFNRQFEEVEQNKNLKFELEGELDGIFLWVYQGLKRLRERGYFNIYGDIQREIDNYRAENNNVISFVDEECLIDVNAEITKQDLYSAYADWAKENGYRSLSKNNLGKELLKQFRGKVKDARAPGGMVRLWLGICLNGQLL